MYKISSSIVFIRLGDREALALRVNALVHPRDRLALDVRAVAAELGGHVLEVLEEVVDGAPLQNAIGRGVAGRRPDVVDLGLLDQVLEHVEVVLLLGRRDDQHERAVKF